MDITEGVSAAVDIKMAAVGEQSGEVVAVGVDGKGGVTQTAGGVFAPCGTIVVDRTVEGLADHVQLSIISKDKFSY